MGIDSEISILSLVLGDCSPFRSVNPANSQLDHELKLAAGITVKSSPSSEIKEVTTYLEVFMGILHTIRRTSFVHVDWVLVELGLHIEVFNIEDSVKGGLNVVGWLKLQVETDLLHFDPNVLARR